MKRKKAFPLLILGAILILAGVGLMLGLRLQMSAAARENQRIVEQIEQILPEQTDGVPGSFGGAGMPALEIEGTDYIALLEIPAFGLKLPVTSRLDSGVVPMTPGRFSGSVYDGTLIIGGADDPQQFAFCSRIEHGVYVTVTDMTGARYSFRVTGIDRDEHASAQWLRDEGADLTIFCRSMNSLEYIAVRCVFAYRLS